MSLCAECGVWSGFIARVGLPEGDELAFHVVPFVARAGGGSRRCGAGGEEEGEDEEAFHEVCWWR